MFSKTNLKVVLAVLAAGLFVVAFAYQASAYSSGGSAPFTYTGEIVGLDNDHSFLTVQAGPNDQLTFRLDNDATVMMCDMNEHFTDLKIGDRVTVSYFEGGTGGYIASQVDSWPIGLNRC